MLLPEATIINPGVTRAFMALCPRCGTDLPVHARFCMQCGAPQATSHEGTQKADTVERRQLTVMMFDLVGSTALASGRDPEELRDAMAIYHRCMAEQIRTLDGFFARVIGDGALVYFGYPEAHEDNAERSVRAALDGVAAVSRLTLLGDHRPQVRVGIATGLAVVGDIVGSGGNRLHDIVGEPPNLAARLQSIAEPNTIIIDEATHRLVGNLFECAQLGPIELKGFAEPVHAWCVLRENAVISRFDAMHATGVTPLVGREDERNVLLRLWALACAGRGQVVLLNGEPGIGKSRLVQELRRWVSGTDHVVMRYYCSQRHQDTALHPVIQQLAFASGITYEDTPELKLQRLEQLLSRTAQRADEVALIADLMSLPLNDRYPALSANAELRKEQTLRSMLRQMRSLAARQPALLILEDVHWIDPTTRELVDRLVHAMQDLPILLVVTARPNVSQMWQGLAYITSVHLTHLTEDESSTLVGHVAAGRELPDDVLDQIVERTDGIPLFVEELTKAVIESATMREDRQRYRLGGPLPSLAIPMTLQDSLIARLDRLGLVKEVIQVASVLGRQFSFDMLAALSPLTGDALVDAMEQLVASELIFARGRPPNVTYTFKHALVLDAAYQSLLRARRRDLHRRAARFIEERVPEVAETQPELLAHHYEESGQNALAANWLLSAGDLAARRYANAEARSHYGRALELLSGADAADTDQRLLIDATVKHISVSFASGSAVDHLSRLLKAEVMAKAIVAAPDATEDDSLRLARLEYWIGRCHHYLNQLPEALHHYEQVLDVAASAEDDELLAMSSVMVGRALAIQGRFEQAATALLRALPILEVRENRSEYLFGLAFLGLTHAARGDYRAGVAAVERVNRIATDLNYNTGIVASYILAWGVHHQGGDPTQMEHCARQIIQTAERAGDRVYVYLGYGMLAWAALMHGDPTTGLSHLERSREISDTLGGRSVISDWLAALDAELLLRAGRPDEALKAAQAAIAEAKAADGIFAEGMSRRTLGIAIIALDATSWDSAELQLRQSIVAFEAGGARVEAARTHLVWGLLCRDRGDEATAVTHLREAANCFSLFGMAGEQRIASSALETLAV